MIINYSLNHIFSAFTHNYASNVSKKAVVGSFYEKVVKKGNLKMGKIGVQQTQVEVVSPISGSI